MDGMRDACYAVMWLVFMTTLEEVERHHLHGGWTVQHSQLASVHSEPTGVRRGTVAVRREHWDEGKGTLHLKRGGAFIIGPYLSAPQLVAQNRTRRAEGRHPAFLARDCTACVVNQRIYRQSCSGAPGGPWLPRSPMKPTLF
jgi:hypothetical protein